MTTVTWRASLVRQTGTRKVRHCNVTYALPLEALHHTRDRFASPGCGIPIRGFPRGEVRQHDEGRGQPERPGGAEVQLHVGEDSRVRRGRGVDSSLCRGETRGLRRFLAR